jgi:superfamily II DNA or RNA helicase
MATKAKSKTKAKPKTIRSVKTSKQTFRNRLARLTYYSACQLLGDEGAQLLRAGGKFDVDFDEDVYLGGDLFRIKLRDPDVSGGVAIASITLLSAASKRLKTNCDQCEVACSHVGAALAVLLEDKLSLGLSAPPDESVPLENLTEEELLARALAERENRAAKERMTVRASNPKQPWTDYVVTSHQSGKTYRVALRGFEPGESYCSCPDFRINHLGTCKHILNVQRKIQRRFNNDRLARGYRRKNLSLRLDYGPRLGLRFNLPNKLDDSVRKVLTPVASSVVDEVPDLMRQLRKLQKMGVEVHIYPDAEEFIEQQLQQQRLQKVAEEIRHSPARHPLRKKMLRTELLPYQLDGIAFAVGAGRAILADDMGLGKTIQGIGVAQLLAQVANISRVLVICPASLKSQWRSEIERFSGRSAQVVLGSAEERAEQYESDSFFTICNYEQVLRDLLPIEQTDWDLIILDEGQRIKNWEAKTTRVVKSLRSRFALVLTGTPLENRLDDLFTITGFIDDRRLGPAYRFFHRHRVVDERGKVLGYRKLDQLRQTLKPVLLRRTREGVLDELPPRTTEIVRIAPTDEQLEMHNAHAKTAAQIAAKKFLTEMDLLRLQKALLMCRMAADSTLLVDKQSPGYSSKLERLAELLERLAAEPDRKVVLFSEWTTMLGQIEPILKRLGLDFVRLDGKVPQKKRQQLVHRFQKTPECRVFITTNAGSTGLNLQAANTVINVDLPWNPAILEQRIARAHRMGQKQPVHVYVLVTEETLEERMLTTLSAKHDLALAALDVESDVDEVQLQSGMEELKRRLEKLLGPVPDAPLDVSKQRDVETETVAISAHRDRVASAGGELLGAALNLIGQLVDIPEAREPSPETVDRLRTSLAGCTDEDENGRPQLKITLPDRQSLDNLATTLARLLVAGQGDA